MVTLKIIQIRSLLIRHLYRLTRLSFNQKTVDNKKVNFVKTTHKNSLCFRLAL